MVAAVVTVALVAGGVLDARGGLDRSPAVLPVDPGDGGQATAADSATANSGDTGGAGAAIEPAPAPGGVAPARQKDFGDQPQHWPRVTYRLKGALPSLPGQARAWKVTDAVDAGLRLPPEVTVDPAGVEGAERLPTSLPQAVGHLAAPEPDGRGRCPRNGRDAGARPDRVRNPRPPRPRARPLRG